MKILSYLEVRNVHAIQVLLRLKEVGSYRAKEMLSRSAPSAYSRTFERIADYCDYRLVYIPLTFMLGFFVSIIVDRWRSIFNNMGWIEK